MQSKMITLTGTLSKIKPEDAGRLGVYLVRGSEILGQANVQPDGHVRLNVVRQAVTRPGAHVQVVLGPAGLKDLTQVPELQRVTLHPEQLEKAETEFRIPLSEIKLTDEILAIWWRWCREYCASGTVIGPNGCPAPYAQVTVYSVTHSGGGYTRTPRATVTTDADGKFTACFWWCTFGPCWPCWPFWWLCWPWWWEWDILRVLDHVEQVLPVQAVQRSPLANAQPRLALRQPDARMLMRGEGFAAARKSDMQITPDPSRTALIQRKLADPRIRALFPWWWWCCDDPNIVFSVSQGSNTIVDEDPAADTRWCFEEGSMVTLVGNAQTVQVCDNGPKPPHGFVWTRVGNITLNHIHGGYADGVAGTDTSDMAFAGGLDIYGEFAASSSVSFYQVDAGPWTGDPSRGGTAPASSTPISADLWNTAVIVHPVGPATYVSIKMGPFSHGGLTNLYATQEARPTAPTGTGLDPFPAMGPGDFLVWAYNGLKVSTNASALIGGGTVGGVDLTISGYDSSFAPVSVSPNDPLTLEIDNLGLTQATINSLTAYRADGTLAPGTGGACPAYDLGPGGYVVLNVTVTDVNGHLFEYEISADFGSGSSGTTTPGLRGYSQAPGTFPGPYAGKPNTALKSFAGGTEDIRFYPAVDCCYDFRLYVGKRVTNGYWFPGLGTATFQTATLKV